MQIQNIQHVFLRSSPVILFERRYLEDGAWVLEGMYVAPAGTETDKLINYANTDCSAANNARALKKVENIQRVLLGGKLSILFEVWGFEDDAWIFEGQHSAPAGTPRRELLNHVE